MKRILLALTVVMSLLLAASLAQADVITNWNYTASAILTDMEWSSGSSGVAGSTGSQKTLYYDTEDGRKSIKGYDTYRWGDSKSKNSGLSVSGSNGAITTDGSAVEGVNVTHRNESISASYKSLTQGTIFTTVELTAKNNRNVNYTTAAALDFHFLETPNSGNYQNDIFFMTSAEIIKSLDSFTVDGNEYYVSIYARLAALSGQYLKMAQQALGVGSDVMLYGWTTKEGKSAENAYDLSLTVSLVPPSVPVPAAVWLMGTGLAGLVACRKRLGK